MTKNDSDKNREHWITLPNGVHCRIEDGRIVDGPKALQGKSLQELDGSNDVNILKNTAPKTSEYRKMLEANGGDHYRTAREFFKQTLQGKAVIATIDGEKCPVFFTGGSLGKIQFGMKQDPIKAEVVCHLADIVATGNQIPNEMHKERSDGTLEYFTFEKTVKMSQGDFSVLVDVADRGKNTPSPIAYSVSREGTKNYIRRKEKEKPAQDAGFSQSALNRRISTGSQTLLASDSERLNNTIPKEDVGVNILFSDERKESKKDVIVDVAEMKDEAPTFSAYGISREGTRNYEIRKEEEKKNKKPSQRLRANPDDTRAEDASVAAHDASLKTSLAKHFEVVNIRFANEKPNVSIHGRPIRRPTPRRRIGAVRITSSSSERLPKRISADTLSCQELFPLEGGGFTPIKEFSMKDSNTNSENIDLALDADSRRRIDDNGFMHVESSHITKEQVVPYRGLEIPGWEKLGLDPDRIYSGYRPAEELEKALHTFNGLPIMLMHHTVSANNPKKEYQVGSMATNAVWNAPYVDNGMIFTDAVGIEAVRNGTCREISCAYQYDPDFTPGVFNGVPYDFVMRNLRGNHVAIVEEGRAGPDVVVADSSGKLKSKGVIQLMSILKDLFRGAQDADPGIEKTKAEETVKEVTGDEDKNAKIQTIIAAFADILTPEDLKKLEDTLTDLAYSKPTGDGELSVPEAVKFGEKKEMEKEERKEIPGGEDNTPPNTAEAVAEGEEDERLKLMRERAEDALKKCGMDAEPDNVKAAFAKGYEYGVHNGEKDMRDPAEREKLDREHEREAMEKRYAEDSAAMVKKVEKSIEEKFAAAREIESAVGVVSPLAFDSADDIFAHALNQMGYPCENKNAAREVFRAIINTRKVQIAQDASPLSGKKFSGDFAGLSNLKIER